MTEQPEDFDDLPGGFVPRLVKKFLDSPLSIMLLLISLLLGALALLITPEEEDPQIVVPIADVFIKVPGVGAAEVEKLVSTPLEQLLWQIDGVEYVYSTSAEESSIVTVRFFVGEDRERSLVKLYNKINSNLDLVPPIVKEWIIKPIEIDDVSILNAAIHSSEYTTNELRRIGVEAISRLQEVKNISRTSVIGGMNDLVRVEPREEALKARKISFEDLSRTLRAANSQINAGAIKWNNSSYLVQTGPDLRNASDIEKIVVGVFDNKPVYLADVAEVINLPDYPTHFTRILSKDGDKVIVQPAVTLALAKKKGTNAVSVASDIKQKLVELSNSILPEKVQVTITRDYGKSAKDKVDDLVNSIFFAIGSIVLILMAALGWREGLIVAISVPVSFSLALFTNYIFGYTINRVTLFALILTLGLVVDDPIINVDNIQRHILRGIHKPFKATIVAVNEVLPPVIVSSLTIIASFVPMFFITGMMGPYMAPMAVNVPLAITYSTVAALTIVPWAAYKLLKGKSGKGSVQKSGAATLYKDAYRKIMGRFLDCKTYRWALLAFILAMAVLSVFLFVFRLVPLKMLPFDNKNELQVVINMPEGTTLEQTDAVVRDFENLLISYSEVVHLTSYVGVPSPIDFNGLVRHYYLREKPRYAEIRINLIGKSERTMQSHGIALKLRPPIEEIAKKHGATVFIVEVPPGPPVVATVVAEVYGPPQMSYETLIKGGKFIENLLAELPGTGDIDISSEAAHEKLVFILNREKASLHGISSADIANTLKMALSGENAAVLHTNDNRIPYFVQVKSAELERAGADKLKEIPLKTSDGSYISLGEIGTFIGKPQDQPIFHKNLKRVVYVYSEAVGKTPVGVVFGLEDKMKSTPMPAGLDVQLAGEGEWFITLRVFRDLGIAFGVALFFIYIILAAQTGSFVMPLVLMTAIPLSIIGIMPGFYLLNLIAGRSIEGYSDPIYFTATAMIGMIALGGIVIRNSSVLISFIEESLQTGMSSREAIIESGIVRIRPIFLTAFVTGVGVLPITLDPIFSGLGWALIFGLFVSTLFSLIVVPVTYWGLYGKSSL